MSKFRSSRAGGLPTAKLEERVYDVAVSDGRAIGSDGRCKTPVGDTVDVENATWTNTIGDTELITVWKEYSVGGLAALWMIERTAGF